MLIFSFILLLVGCYAAILSTTNKKRLIQLNATEKTELSPFISIVIPARNEETTIEQCVRSMMEQSYTNLEILVLDDNSTDGTADKVLALQKEDTRVRYIRGRELNDGWRGKLFAMQQLFEESKGEFLLFTDCDTVHGIHSVQFGLNVLVKHKASLLSGYPLQRSTGIFTWTLISVMILNTVLYLPIKLQEKLQFPGFSMAIGQYLFIRKSALIAIGGFSTMKNVICDDVMLARTFARNGHKQMFADLKNNVSCTMYTSFKDSFKGTERSITGVIKQSVPMFFAIFVAAMLLIGCAFSLPFSAVLLVISKDNPAVLLPGTLALVGSFLLFGSWIRMALFHGYPFKVAIMGPLSFLFVVSMYIHGYYLRVSGKGFVWKDRKIT
ncbi:glycosyl transferase [Sphaerochaeta pleomorpha str. Grapes]|uniref:Glycosyl transferase n=1 Tax=Sphaerochaeta pleomorpha (strain ATCC BAA-1885 / DSM 22778 / Grapes) TaxID=158190 RepID=G8QTL5_SPHPG|nr:glycosyltransferase family 2 protein [Sphaerochaeta pleomorpha]AEV27980.1 glycosyl transferase [Sphaerochaeta pleomorpha str. Grapes]